MIVSSSRQPKVQDAIARLQKSYPSKASSISGQACSLDDPSTMEENLKTLLDFASFFFYYKVYNLIYTAGDAIAIMKLESIDVATAQKAGMVRFFGPLLLGKLAPAYMNPGPASSITLTTGSVSERPRPDWTLVGSYATGLQGMARGLALDLKPLRVNLVSPGAVNTEMWDMMGAEKKFGMMKHIADSQPTGRIAGPDDIAEAYLFCAKDRNTTGSFIRTDGGQMLA